MSYFVNRFLLNLLLFLIPIVASITLFYKFKRGVELKPIFGTVDGTTCAYDYINKLAKTTVREYSQVGE